MADDAIKFVELTERCAISVTGPDMNTFLNGLISNDIRQVSSSRGIYSTFLTPQGKFLHDFLIAATDDGVLLLCERERRSDLLRRLKIYKLRSKVDLTDRADDYRLFAVFGKGAAAAFGLDDTPGSVTRWQGGLAMVDPRSVALGVVLVVPANVEVDTFRDQGIVPADRDDWDRLRIPLAIPDGSRDIEVERAGLMESNVDEANGISWDKGCYLGQELTARTRYRGLVKRRLVPLQLTEGTHVEPGSTVMDGDKRVGEVRSSVKGVALAALKLAVLDPGRAGQGFLTIDGATATPLPPTWMEADQASSA